MGPPCSVGDMIEAFHHIDQITNHPVPWPYTHLTQFFTLIWVYTLPLFLVHEYGPGSFVIITFMAVILFGMDTVRVPAPQKNRHIEGKQR